MTDFIALYRGRTISEAEMVAVCAEERIVGKFFAELLGEPEAESTEHEPPELAVVHDEN